MASIGLIDAAPRGGGFRGDVGRYGVPRAVIHLLFGPPKPRTLRPRGYSGFVERMGGPAQIAASVALTIGAIFVMAQGLLKQFSDSLAKGQIPSFQVMLMLATLFIMGFLIDTALLTSVTRFRMHAIRHEWGWMTISLVMFTLCIGVEGLTWTYLGYEVEPQLLPAGALGFIQSLPGVLFFVRAFMGPVALSYLGAAVLPLTIQRADVDREIAAQTGGAAVTLIHEMILHIQKTGIGNFRTMVQLLHGLLTILRVATNGDSEARDAAIRDAFTILDKIEDAGAPGVAAILDHTIRAELQPPMELRAALGSEDEDEDETAITPSQASRVLRNARTGNTRRTAVPSTPRGKGKPSPGSPPYTNLIVDTIRKLQARHVDITVEAVADEMGEKIETARPYIQAVIEEAA